MPCQNKNQRHLQCYVTCSNSFGGVVARRSETANRPNICCNEQGIQRSQCYKFIESENFSVMKHSPFRWLIKVLMELAAATTGVVLNCICSASTIKSMLVCFRTITVNGRYHIFSPNAMQPTTADIYEKSTTVCADGCPDCEDGFAGVH